MVRADCRRDDQRANLGEVSRIVTRQHLGTQGRQVGRTCWIRIAPAYGNPAATGDEGERTHAGSTDSHEVNGALIRGVEQGH
jgi:hypothetical protein